jgi:general secretion pathway protein B
MSILLEALRKTEKNQHTREVPTIYTDDHSGPVAEPMKTGPLALLLVAALFTSGWFVWQQYQAPANGNPLAGVEADLPAVDTKAPAADTQTAVAGAREPAASPQQTAVDSGLAAPVSSTDAAVAADSVPAVSSPDASDKPVEQTPSSSSVAGSPSRQQRTPMESYQPPADAVTQSKPTVAEPSATRRAPAQTADAGASKPVEPAATTHEPEEPAPISYWELPDAVRADLPEIKYSVLVYASKPADRFVLINGERLAEGDSPQPGLTVKEIRRDGVIFSYRLYQFLIGK